LSSELSPNVHFEFSSGELDASVKKGMVFGDSGFFFGVSAGDTAFRARLNRDTGLLSGEGALYGEEKKTPFRGAVLSKGATQGGQGFFLSPKPLPGTGTGKSGKFSIVIAGNAGAEVVISEFMAKNNSVIRDEDGDFSDWIEIYNPGKSSVNLDGWHLTDDSKDPVKWKFPAVILPADGFLVVWASGKNRVDSDSPLHTNFSLSAPGVACRRGVRAVDDASSGDSHRAGGV
jgi:hypothetical protein